MESITTLNGLSWMVLGLIDAGCVLRIVFCTLHLMSAEPQDSHQMKRRIRNIIIFLMVANGIFALNGLAQYYWG